MAQIISEIGSNWYCGNGIRSFRRALDLIHASHDAGADAIKFQLFRANSLVRDQSAREGLHRHELPMEWIGNLRDRTTSLGMDFLCTPFDVDAVGFLDPYVPAWKIASWDITYLPLLEKIADSIKPVLLSTGAATKEEIHQALNILGKNNKHITLLHCVSGYPTPPQEAKLDKLKMLNDTFGHRILGVGFSSHITDPIITASSIFYGASVIEVHFDLGDGKGVEAGHSYTPESLAELRRYADLFEQARRYEGDFSEDDCFARTNYRRDPSDWLRPVL